MFMYKYQLLLFLPLFYSFSIVAQNWTGEVLAPMPEAVSNHAVATATVHGVPHVYSFSGIDATKIWSGLHNRAFRYNTQTNVWDTIPSLPSERPRIAAGASTVNNLIYIMGGYQVFANQSELSLDDVFIYNPETNSYLPNGTPIPVPIDDHIQAVWRDSLIFLVTGWSNTTNVGNVQIYNPATDNWQVGTPVPNNTNYEVFGGSGTIIGDTIYYAGGATINGAFELGKHFRKGYINPNNPTEIEWEAMEIDAALGYRMGVLNYENTAIWVGGSAISYNFNGIAYNGSGGVSALGRMVEYNPQTGQLIELLDQIPATMDFRGIAQIAPNQYILCGGMVQNQEVTNQTYLLENFRYMPTAVSDNRPNITFSVYPNPAYDYLSIKISPALRNNSLTVMNAQGKVIATYPTVPKYMDVQDWGIGTYWAILGNDAFSKKQDQTGTFFKFLVF